MAPVRRGGSNDAAAQSRPIAPGARRCEKQAGRVGAPWRATAENPLCPRVSKANLKGGRAGGSHWIANRKAKGEARERVTARYFSRQEMIEQKSVQWVP